jgi:Protein of unknown function (DUF3105)
VCPKRWTGGAPSPNVRGVRGTILSTRRLGTAGFGLCAFVLYPLASCGGSPFEPYEPPPAADAAYEASAPVGPCDAVVQEQAIEGFLHVPVCSYVAYGTKPPSSGNHYPIWAAYKTYTSPVPEGFFVHNLEHGTIVLTYNCPDGCDDDVTAAQTMLDALPADPDCAAQGSAVRRRSLMTPDPDLDVPFAASAWGWTLRAKCFDPVAFQAFALAHYNQGREDICADGLDVSTGVAADCGEAP